MTSVYVKFAQLPAEPQTPQRNIFFVFVLSRMRRRAAHDTVQHFDEQLAPPPKEIGSCSLLFCFCFPGCWDSGATSAHLQSNNSNDNDNKLRRRSWSRQCVRTAAVRTGRCWCHGRVSSVIGPIKRGRIWLKTKARSQQYNVYSIILVYVNWAVH